MPYRNKTYVCFDGDSDIHYYRLMCAWKQNDGFDFNFHNAHDLNFARDTSQEASIKKQLRERLASTKVLVVLIGQQTRYLHRFVRWEMEQALSLRLPIIGVNLDGLRQQNPLTCPPVIAKELVIYVPFKPSIIFHAMSNWPLESQSLKLNGRTGPFHYEADVYRKLGITS